MVIVMVLEVYLNIFVDDKFLLYMVSCYEIIIGVLNMVMEVSNIKFVLVKFLFCKWI